MLEFAECIGGLSHCKGSIRKIVSDKRIRFLGMKKETHRIGIKLPEDVSSYNLKKGELPELIENAVPDGWMLWDDGLRSQQNNHGYHNIIVYRYIEAKDDES